MEIPEKIYKALESVENGSQLIEELKTVKSQLNNEAKTHRQKLNQALDTFGVEKGNDDFNAALAKRREELELVQKELQMKAEKESKEKMEKMSETERLQNQITEFAKKQELLEKDLKDRDLKLELSERDKEIQGILKSAGVAPQYQDDLALAIQTKLQKGDGGWNYTHNGSSMSLQEGIKAHLAGKDGLIAVNQRSGGEGSSGSTSGAPTKADLRESRRRRLNKTNLW